MTGCPVDTGGRLVLPVGGWEGRPQDRTALWSPDLRNRGPVHCVWRIRIQVIESRMQGADGPQSTSGLYSRRAWHKVIHLKWYPARVFVSLERDMAEFQGETVDTTRPLWVTSTRSLWELPLGPAIKLTLGPRTSAVLLPALCFSTYGGSYHWLSGSRGILLLLVSQVTVPCSEHHCPLFHGELGSEAGNRSCKPEKGSLEPRVPAPFPYLHNQKEEKCDQTHVYILRMNGWRFLSIPSAPLKEHLSSLSCAFPVSWSRQKLLQGDNTVRRGPIYIYIFFQYVLPTAVPIFGFF